MAKRGRKPRAVARATERIELRLTLEEARSVRRLAQVNGLSLADLTRVYLLKAAHESGEASPIRLSRALVDRIVAGRERRARRIVAGNKKASGVRSAQE